MLNQEDQPSKHICLKLIKLLGICNVDYWTYTKTTPIHFIARDTRAATTKHWASGQVCGWVLCQEVPQVQANRASASSDSSSPS